MHIAEGLLPPVEAAVLFALAAPFVVKGVSEIKRRTRGPEIDSSWQSAEGKRSSRSAGERRKVREINESRRNAGAIIPLLGLLTAAVFIISLLPVPVPVSGTSSHMGGTPLVAVLFGPWIGTVLGAIAMFFQALFFAHGGLTTLGANVLSEGVAGSFAAFAVFKLIKRSGLSLVVAAFAAGLMGDLAIYLMSSFELAVALHGNASILTAWGAFLVAYMPTQIPLALIEGVMTGGVINYLGENRPDLLERVGLRLAPVQTGESAV